MRCSLKSELRQPNPHRQLDTRIRPTTQPHLTTPVCHRSQNRRWAIALVSQHSFSVLWRHSRRPWIANTKTISGALVDHSASLQSLLLRSHLLPSTDRVEHGPFPTLPSVPELTIIRLLQNRSIVCSRSLECFGPPVVSSMLQSDRGFVRSPAIPPAEQLKSGRLPPKLPQL